MKKYLAILGLFVGFHPMTKSQIPRNGSNAQQQAESSKISPILTSAFAQIQPSASPDTEHHNAKPYQWHELYAPANIPNWALAGLAGWAGFLALRTLRKIHTQTVAAILAAKAAKASADVASGVSIPHLVVHELGNGYTTAIDPEVFFQHPRLKIIIKNYGQTPAFLKYWTLCFSCESLPEVPIYDSLGTGMILDKIVILQNGEYALPIVSFFHATHFSLEEAQAIIKREKTFRVYGYVCYGDIFGNPLKRMKFCETVLNVFGGEMVCDWWEGLAPPVYSGTEVYPLKITAVTKAGRWKRFWMWFEKLSRDDDHPQSQNPN
jgi:hypothetical protein